MALVKDEAVETFKPAGPYVLLRLIKPTAMVALPASYREDQPRSVVVAVGEGQMFSTGLREEIPFKVGDVVVCGGDGTVILLKGEAGDMSLIDHRKILGTVQRVK